MSTALEICESAFRQANVDQALTSFSTSQEFPYNIAIDLINTVIQDLNRQGNFWFTQTVTTVSSLSSTIDLNLLNIDPKRLIRIRREENNQQGELLQVNWRVFQRQYRQSAIISGKPTVWSKYASLVELNVIPDHNYELKLYHFQDMPAVTQEDDVLAITKNDEDVIRDGVYAYLLQRMGRPDFNTAYQLYQNKLKNLLSNQKQDAGLSSQLPANF
jgi:hypothetical protein